MILRWHIYAPHYAFQARSTRNDTLMECPETSTCRSAEYIAIQSQRLSMCVYVLCRPLQAAASPAVLGPSPPADLTSWNCSQVHVAPWCFEYPVRWHDLPLSRLADPAYTVQTLCLGSTIRLMHTRIIKDTSVPEGLGLALHHKERRHTPPLQCYEGPCVAARGCKDSPVRSSITPFPGPDLVLSKRWAHLAVAFRCSKGPLLRSS